jgi:hypothetical protein
MVTGVNETEIIAHKKDGVYFTIVYFAIVIFESWFT